MLWLRGCARWPALAGDLTSVKLRERRRVLADLLPLHTAERGSLLPANGGSSGDAGDKILALPHEVLTAGESRTSRRDHLVALLEAATARGEEGIMVKDVAELVDALKKKGVV